MFSRKKKTDAKKSKTTASRPKKAPHNEFGFDLGLGKVETIDDKELEAELFALTGSTSAVVDPTLSDSDSDVEAELLKLIGSSKTKKKILSTQQPMSSVCTNDKLVTKDITSMKFDSIDKDDIGDEEVDEDDPELLNELLELNQEDEIEAESSEEEEVEEPQKPEPNVLEILNERLELYKTAEKKAKEAKESSRARRFNRGMKTLESLIKEVKAGKPIAPSDIPPMIAINLKPAPLPSETPDVSTAEAESNEGTEGQGKQTVKIPQTVDPNPSGQEEVSIPEAVKLSGPSPSRRPQAEEVFVPELPKTNEGIEIVQERKPKPSIKQDLSVEIKESLEIVKENQMIILIRARREEYKAAALQAKKAGELSSALAYVKSVKVLDGLLDKANKGESITESEVPPSLTAPQKAGRPQPPAPQIRRPAPPPPTVNYSYKAPTTVMEALQQRLSIYKTMLVKAEKEGNANAKLQNAKIVRLYMEVIKLHAAGKSIPLAKLPTPPGCPPIPLAFQA